MNLKVNVERKSDTSPSPLGGGGGNGYSVGIEISGADFGGRGYGNLPIGTLDAIFKGAKTLVLAEGGQGAARTARKK